MLKMKKFKLNPYFKRIVIGMSGGVDSAVSALILKDKGFEIIGAYMQNWDSHDEIGNCLFNHDIEDAEKTCSQLGIPFVKLNFIKEYWNEVFSNFIQDYESGITPNPDVLCNRHIKFNHFFKYCIEKLNADAIATGHYASTTFGCFLEHYDPEKGVRLLKAKDEWKDQCFFLSQVSQYALQRTMFPIGEMTKSEVKAIAKERGLLSVANRKESMGICFIGSRNFPQFISEYVPNKKGRFIEINSGDHIGNHFGIHLWTIGQRCRIGGQLNRLFIAKKDSSTQDVFVAKKNHPMLWSKCFVTAEAHWIHSLPLELVLNNILSCDFKFQHRDSVLECNILKLEDNKLVVNLTKPMLALTRGQFAVFYMGRECLGSAKIISVGPSLFSLNKLYS